MGIAILRDGRLGPRIFLEGDFVPSGDVLSAVVRQKEPDTVSMLLALKFRSSRDGPVSFTVRDIHILTAARGSATSMVDILVKQTAEVGEISEQQRQQQIRQFQLEQHQQQEQQHQQLLQQQPPQPQQQQQHQQHSQQQQLQQGSSLMGVAVTSGTAVGSGYEQQQSTEAQETGTGGGDEQMGEGEDATHGQPMSRLTAGVRGKFDGDVASHKSRGDKREDRPGREREISKGPTGEAKGSGSSRSRSPGRDRKDHKPWSR